MKTRRRRILGWIGTGLALLSTLPVVFMGTALIGFLVIEIPVRVIVAVFGGHTGSVDRLWWP